tara:strand:+ start:3632 stop:4822 length:1191 start_codon:yes stop_codon:yes gene_type:complete
MKVLYIGCYRDGTGWANAAQGYILSLDKANVDVVPRFLKLNETQGEVDKRIVELEEKSSKNCDVVIQHVLPHYFDYNGNFDKNIGLYVTETSNCINTAWPERINLMDEAWVPNLFMATEACKQSLIHTPHYVIPHAFDLSKYQEEYEPLQIPEIKDKFVFYYIGEATRRKNIGAMLKAFHLEFAPNEDVSIVIKAHIPGQTPVVAENYLKEMSDKIKEGLKLYQHSSMYHSEIFMGQYLTDEQIMRLHATCDCFVSASFGEAWGIPIFDAMALGKTPICTDSGGPKDFIQGGGYLVQGRDEPCFGASDTFDEIYVGNESWSSPSIIEIMKKMRSAYEDKKTRQKKSVEGINTSYEYSYSNVGKLMKDTLEGTNMNVANQDNIIKSKHCVGKLLNEN